MTKLEELIQELCPNDVEYRSLENCCEILDNKRKPVTKAAREAGEYPYYGANGIQDYVADYIFDGTFVLVGEDGSVVTEKGTPVYCCLGQNVAVIHPKINARYLYYILSSTQTKEWINQNVKGASQKSLSLADIKRLPIPFVSEAEQMRIASILDRFDTLCNNISEGLPAEIEARQKQYEYYRDKLLNSTELNTKGA